MSRAKVVASYLRSPLCAGALLIVLASSFAFRQYVVLSAASGNPEPPVRVPSNVAWTPETVAFASSGDAFRGLLIARRCNHCHGSEGFSSEAAVPNLAGEDLLYVWKQLEDFGSGKRESHVMQPIAGSLSPRDMTDVAKYFSMLPTASDPQDTRSFPQAMQDASFASTAVRLIVFGDGQRGIPPCQSCHGPVGYVRGASTLAYQNGGYLRQQLEDFAPGIGATTTTCACAVSRGI